jgi:diaminobutyrate-2-oxoglutarate transaminase
MIAYAGGAAGIHFMLENKLADHSLQLGEKMISLLREIEEDSPIIGEARGKGLMLGVEFVKDKETKETAPELASKIRKLCHQNGVFIDIGCHYFFVAIFLPPLVITEELAKKGVEIFADSVKELEKEI